MKMNKDYIKTLIRTRIKQKNPNAEIILLGSQARGDFNKNSDWDILILLNQLEVSRDTEMEYREELFEVELETGEPISTFVFSKNDWESKHKITPLYQNIKTEGIEL
jgi:predicted nucleotidyltransferase